MKILSTETTVILGVRFRFLKILKMASISLMFFLTANGISAQTCKLENNDREWIEHTIALWQKVSRDSLGLKSAPPPWIVLFDETCVWHVNPDLSVLTPKLPNDSVKTKLTFAPKVVDVYGIAHEGNITLPNKQQIPPQLTTFAATYNGGKKPFLVAAMPSVWQKAPHLKTEVNLNVLIRSVFVHEMTHTRHRNFFERLNQIEKQNVFSEDFDDDIVQNHFSKIEDFRKSYETERDLLYQAVGETDIQKKRQSARNALDIMQARRQKFFVGTDSIYTQIEDIFLTMEGAANWAAYRSAKAEGLSETDALKLIRRDGKHWSQDEGLALFLLADSFIPGWQKKVFGKSEVSIIDLLQKVINEISRGIRSPPDLSILRNNTVN
jgi:hypothetical protein